MSRTIRIDDEVYEGLKKLADPFEDTPNTVIRRLLIKLDVIPRISAADIKAAQKMAGKRIAKESQATPQRVYEQWLLHTLWHKFQGKAAKPDVTKETVDSMQKYRLLTKVDFEDVPSGGQMRAENLIAWARNQLRKIGLIRDDSKVGIWELTDEGIKVAKEIHPPKRREHF
jgi:predicted CopG family antitoxin